MKRRMKRKTDGPGAQASLALYAQQMTAMHNLWAVYVVATFAAAGFGSSADFGMAAAVAVSVGFWLFALGHLALLRQTLIILERTRRDLANLGPSAFALGRTWLAMRRIGNPVWIAVAVHLGIDLCVTAAIWSEWWMPGK